MNNPYTEWNNDYSKSSSRIFLQGFDMQSQFHFYSLGIAAENKARTSRHLAVTPTETTPALDGEITFNPQEKTFSGLDRDGESYEVKVTEDLTVTAEWLPMGSNRVTPPDIRRGEPIALYRLADTDRFYWRCMGLRDDLRRLETVIFAWNGSPDEGSEGINIDECYFLEISTHNRMITLGTSKANGEPFRYYLQFNTGEGQVTLQDDIGNHLHLNSGQILWELRNADGTYFKLDRKDIHGHAPESIALQAGRDIEFTAGSAIRLQAGNEIYQTAPTCVIDADKVTVKANTHDVTCPTSSYSGNLNIGGNLGIGGGGGGNSATIHGNLHLVGDMRVTGTMYCDRLVASTSVNAPNL